MIQRRKQVHKRFSLIISRQTAKGRRIINKKEEQIIKRLLLSFKQMNRQHRQLVVPGGVQDLPTTFQERNCTDVCCLIAGLAFSIIMFIIAIATFSYAKFERVNFPADSDGRLCGIDKAGYPYVYFVNPPQMQRRVCVAECPKSSQNDLKCIPTNDIGCSFSSNPGFEVVYYENEAVQTRSGHFCMPKDEELKKKLLINSDLEARDSFYNSIDTIVLCFFVALGFSVLYFVLVQLLPKIMNYAAVIVGALVILVTIICVFTYNTPQTGLKNLAGFVLLIILIIIALTVLKNRDSWRMHAVFLKYSTKMIKQRLATLAYIPIFFEILVCFVIIVVLQFTAFWTTGTIIFDHTQSLYHTFTGFLPILLSILLIIQTIWGLTFIKEAFNFCVSGQAVLWYYDESSKGFIYPLKLLILKHCGSVIAGSFMTGFLSFLDFVFDFIKPDQKANPDGCYTKFYGKACAFCVGIFDLVRSDAMAYINLAGNPFCNSSRYCEYLCNQSVIMDYSQSTSRAYRICAHFLIAGIMAIFALYVKGNISIYALLIIMVQTLFIATLLISTHADAAEAIQIIFLVDEEFARRERQDVNNFDIMDRNNNLEGLKLHEDLVNQVREERQKLNRQRQDRRNKRSAASQ